MEITIRSNGLRLVGPAKPKRNDFIRVFVNVTNDQGRSPGDAWNDAVSLAYSTYGAVANEDGTIGQCAQLVGADGSKRDLPTLGRVFSFGLNLWGRRQRDVLASIAASQEATR